MPGLYGSINNNPNLKKDIEQARKLLIYSKKNIVDNFYIDQNILSGRVHLGIIGEKKSPFIDNEIYCWAEGEIYNLNEVANIFNINADSFVKLLSISYQQNNLGNVLQKIDGYFQVVIYDKKEKRINIISDRYGLKHIYYWFDHKNFAWAPEIKFFTKLSNFKIEILPEAIDCFMSLGHMMGDITWFENVELLKAATILEYDLIKRKICFNRYWSWSKIKHKNISFTSVVDELGPLLKKAVNKRIFNQDKKIGLSLSGGLDSRVIAASVNEPDKILCYSFGMAKSIDIEIAKQVADVRNNHFFLYEINNSNWLNQRLQHIWLMDGMLSMMHMHISSYVHELEKNINISFNGFMGDLNVGGSWINQIDLPINSLEAKKKFGNNYRLDSVQDVFYKTNHTDPYMINNRVRRFTIMGIIESSKFIEQRLPFMDNDINEFIYSISDKYRINSKLYKAVLIKFFPEYFLNIPWQKTGQLITEKNYRIIYKIKNAFNFIMNKNRSYADYNNWLKDEQAVKIITNILKNKNLLYTNYLNTDYYTEYFLPHLQSKKDNSEILGRIITLETWLNQLINNDYKAIYENNHSL